ncbi:MAG: branched-chain amino acid transport system permease protein, partial [Solirubrobacteraceae bacterium]|nr:branched-chain amino acid transport system permease protein [Solirubrobacteraceae bacterium]
MARVGAIARAATPVVGLLVPLALLAVLLAGISPDVESSVITALINLVVVVGLYVFVGNSGVLSFGHVSFMAVGAYATALLTISEVGKGILLPHLPGFLARAEMGLLPAMLIAAAVAGVIAFVVAVPLMRLNGIAASIATLSVLAIMQVVIQRWESLTGGQGTLTGVPVDTSLGTALLWACVACVAAYLFQRSASGLRLRASRDDEPASRSIGVRVGRERRLAFTLSAVIVAIGGALYGHFIGSLTPNAFYLQITFVTLAMLVVGGVGSLAGAVVGTTVVSAITEILARLESGGSVGPIDIPLRPGVRDMVVAALTMLILVARPAGITG